MYHAFFALGMLYCMFTYTIEDTNLLFLMRSQYGYNTAYTIT